MLKPSPSFDAFDSTKDCDCRPAGSHDCTHMIQQQQWNNRGNSQPLPRLFDSQAAGDSFNMPGHQTPMTPFGDTKTKDYSCGTEHNTPKYTSLHSTMTSTLGDAGPGDSNIYMTQHQNGRGTSKLFPPQAVGDSTTTTARTFHPQAVGGSPAGTEDNIYLTQQQKNYSNTPQLLFPPYAVGGSIPNAQLFHSQTVGGSTTTTTTAAALPGNNTHRGMSYTAPTVTPITPATEASKGISGSGIRPTVQNIVATVNLGCKLDLKLIVQKARNAEYNPKRFGAVIMRIREPRTTALIFSSGKMVCTGATSEEQSRLASRKFARTVQKLGFPAAKFLDFKIQNMVASCDVRFPVRLETLYIKHQRFSHYDPESFPGLVYKMIKPKINLLLFVSGKVVLTGAKAREDINQAFENIYPILKSFEKTLKRESSTGCETGKK